ncbi:hypothetical protein LBYZC6_44030 [Lacrimispora brassicae]
MILLLMAGRMLFLRRGGKFDFPHLFMESIFILLLMMYQSIILIGIISSFDSLIKDPIKEANWLKINRRVQPDIF